MTARDHWQVDCDTKATPELMRHVESVINDIALSVMSHSQGLSRDWAKEIAAGYAERVICVLLEAYELRHL